MDNTRDLLVRGMAAAKAGLKGEARFFLDWLLRLDPPKDQKNEALYWLSSLASTPEEERRLLESILANDLNDPRARRRLLILDGKIKTGDLINPDRYEQEIDLPQVVKTDKFTCSNCGGRLTYSPDGSSLECEYCNSRQFFKGQTGSLINDRESGQDFIAAMAMASGHNQVIAQQIIICNSCGAEYLLTKSQISTSCPYCHSQQVVNYHQIKQMIPPARIIPLEIGYQQAFTSAQKVLQGNLEIHEMYDVRPAFYPVWQFSLDGEVSWRLPSIINTDEERTSGKEQIAFHTVPVFAIESKFEQFNRLVEDFNYSRIEPYSPVYLVDCLALGYQIPLSDAALTARELTVREYSRRIEKKLGRKSGDFFISSSDLFITQFWLTLVPLWLFNNPKSGQAAIVNGQTGKAVFGMEKK